MVCPGNQPGSPSATVPDWSAEGQTEGTHIAFPAIHGQQERTFQCDTANLHCQLLGQTQVALGADDATQPEPRRDHQRHRHPQHPTLGLDANFIALDLSQVHCLASDHLLMDPLSMVPCLTQPIAHGPLI